MGAVGGETAGLCVCVVGEGEEGGGGALYIPRQYIHFSFPPSAAHVTAPHAAVERQFLFFDRFCFVVFLLCMFSCLRFNVCMFVCCCFFKQKQRRARAYH